MTHDIYCMLSSEKKNAPSVILGGCESPMEGVAYKAESEATDLYIYTYSGSRFDTEVYFLQMLQKRIMILLSYTCFVTLTVVWWPLYLLWRHWKMVDCRSQFICICVIAHPNHQEADIGLDSRIWLCEFAQMLVLPSGGRGRNGSSYFADVNKHLVLV